MEVTPVSAGKLGAISVDVHFGGVQAVNGVDLTLECGEILGVIGPNGAGKTTLVNVLTGFQLPTRGQVVLGEKAVTGWSPDAYARHGVARTFQAVRLFRDLTVAENVQAGAIGVGMGRRAAAEITEDLLDRLGLTQRASVAASSLPHGDERRLGLARALATQPRFLLLDEPAAGLNEAESDALVSFLLSITESLEIGLLIIEHDMRLVMGICKRIQVLDHGRTIALGSPAEIRTDPVVLTAYLGSEDEDVVA